MKKQKDTFTIETVSDDLRERSAAADDSFSESRKASVTFRKVFKGFDEVEVLQFIEDQEEAFKSASSIYERTLEDSKSENTLLRRENKALKQNIAELEDRIKELQGEDTGKDKAAVPDEAGFIAEPLTAAHGVELAPPIEKSAESSEQVAELEAQISEYTAQLAELQAQVSTLESENAELKGELEQAKAALASIESGESAEPAVSSEELEQAKATIAELNEKLSENESALAAKEAELAAAAAAPDENLNEKRAELETKLAEKTAECEKLLKEFEDFKRDAGDGAVLADSYNKQTEKLTAELTQLRAENQKQAYEYAEKLNTLEVQSVADRAKVSQQMKMHTYHLRQIDTLLAQLTEQFELAREAVEKF